MSGITDDIAFDLAEVHLAKQTDTVIDCHCGRGPPPNYRQRPLPWGVARAPLRESDAASSQTLQHAAPCCAPHCATLHAPCCAPTPTREQPPPGPKLEGQENPQKPRELHIQVDERTVPSPQQSARESADSLTANVVKVAVYSKQILFMKNNVTIMMHPVSDYNN